MLNTAARSLAACLFALGLACCAPVDDPATAAAGASGAATERVEPGTQNDYVVVETTHRLRLQPGVVTTEAPEGASPSSLWLLRGGGGTGGSGAVGLDCSCGGGGCSGVCTVTASGAYALCSGSCSAGSGSGSVCDGEGCTWRTPTTTTTWGGGVQYLSP